ncbi:MAG: 2-C-methyl-D-erythritol 2,4-cyclodiphosphate synthase [Clostridia bacterium]|nr:2-C-methyl-D-erythritol 2,4-cyclodiphosphate synthase [Clostridia bacterium]
MSICAVILCGGSGSRMGTKESKTLLTLGGEPAVIRCAKAFHACADHTVLVVRPEEEPLFRSLFQDFHLPLYQVAYGGDTRQQSVKNALNALPEDCDIVLIHDGARAMVSEAVIRRVIDSAREHGSGIPAVPVKDTIKEAHENIVSRTLDRSCLYAMQTPQGFQTELLLKAHRSATQDCTDDAALLENMQYPVYLVDGDPLNFKLTTPEDYQMAKSLFPALPRIGTGFDAHRLVEGRRLILCGVEVPYEKGLLGHSDADVALHALTDAMLGAMAMGDIGKLFPDSDMSFKDISSVLLMERAYAKIKEKGYRLGNCDVTIVAQKPKLSPYIEAMRANIARALETDISQVSVKATTTEKMGYEGQGEGISAQSVCLLIPC